MREIEYREVLAIRASQLETGDRFALSSSDVATIFNVIGLGFGIDRPSDVMEIIVNLHDDNPALSLLVSETRRVWLLSPLPELVMPHELVAGDRFSVYPSDEPILIDHVCDGGNIDLRLRGQNKTFVYIDETQFYCLSDDGMVYRHLPMRIVMAAMAARCDDKLRLLHGIEQYQNDLKEESNQS